MRLARADHSRQVRGVRRAVRHVEAQHSHTQFGAKMSDRTAAITAQVQRAEYSSAEDVAWLLAELDAARERIALLRAEVDDLDRIRRMYQEVKS